MDLYSIEIYQNFDTVHWGLGEFINSTLDPSDSGLRSPRGDSPLGPELVEVN